MTEIQQNTQRIRELLSTGISSESIAEAATLLLKITRNRILHESIMRTSNVRLCVYNLEKTLQLRGEQGAADHREKEVKAAPIINRLDGETAEEGESRVRFGKRLDHDTLPADVQELYSSSLALYSRMRSVHEKCKLLTQPCDRAEFVHQLLSLETQMRENFDAYDVWKEGEFAPAIVDAKRINANRTFITKAKKRLPEIIDQAKAEALRQEVSLRLKELIDVGSAVTDQLLGELKALGVKC